MRATRSTLLQIALHARFRHQKYLALRTRLRARKRNLEKLRRRQTRLRKRPKRQLRFKRGRSAKYRQRRIKRKAKRSSRYRRRRAKRRRSRRRRNGIDETYSLQNVGKKRSSLLVTVERGFGERMLTGFGYRQRVRPTRDSVLDLSGKVQFRSAPAHITLRKNGRRSLTYLRNLVKARKIKRPAVVRSTSGSTTIHLNRDISESVVQGRALKAFLYRPIAVRRTFQKFKHNYLAKYQTAHRRYTLRR
jgi:hypothetical protein